MTLRTTLVTAALCSLLAVEAKGQAPFHGAEKSLPSIPAGMILSTPTIPRQVKDSWRTINETLSRDVKPSENAVVLLVPIYGEYAFEDAIADASMAMLGLRRLPPDSPEILTAEEFVKEEGARSPREIDIAAGELDQELITATTGHWTRETFPRLAKYLDLNTKPLEVLEQASLMPGFYAPMLPLDEPASLMGPSLTIERRLPYLSRLLVARANLAWSEKRYADAERDLITCHRLARLLAVGAPFDVSGSKAHVMDAYAYQAELKLLQDPHYRGAAAKEYLQKLEAVGPLPDSAIAADVGERAVLHQEIDLLRSSKDAWIGFLEHTDDEGKPSKQIPSRSAINWEAARAGADAIQDRVVAALKEQDHVKQEGMFAALDQEYEVWLKADDEKLKNLEADLKSDPDAVSRWVGTNMAWSLKTLYRQRRATDDRARARRDLVRLGLALAAYRGDHQQYPEQLDALSPDYLGQVPLDPHSAQPWMYTRKPDGTVQIVSYGHNQRNDANQGFNDDLLLELN